jgi:hypothetical protein
VRRPGRRPSEAPAGAAFAAGNPFDEDLGAWLVRGPVTGQGTARGDDARPAGATAEVGATARRNASGQHGAAGQANGAVPAAVAAGLTANGHDGASAADLLGQLRTLLGPLLATSAQAAGTPGGEAANGRDRPAGPASAAAPAPPATPATHAPAASPAPAGRAAPLDPAEALLPRRLPRPLPRLAPGRPGPVPPADDEELRRIAESEEAWW